MLEELHEYFEIVVWTASFPFYANPVLDYLDPERKLIDHRLFRDDCVRASNGIFVKDIRMLVDRKPENVVIIDNAPSSFASSLWNGIPIMPFFDNRRDVELKYLCHYLLSLAAVSDVRPVLQHTYKLHLFEKVQSVGEWIQHFLQPW